MIKNIKTNNMPRASGVLLHITSLPSSYGIGTMGEEAKLFIRFLKNAGQTYWQILPLGTTGYGNSPYQNFSIHAGNPYLIDFNLLVEDGLLQVDAPQNFSWGEDPSRVDYNLIYQNKKTVLYWAYETFLYHKPQELLAEKEEFFQKNKDWLVDYACFMLLKEKFQGKSWQAWDDEYRRYDVRKLEKFAENNKADLDYYYFEQYIFYRQWKSLRDYAEINQIKIIGDLPIYVAVDSVDVWANPEFFQLDKNLQPSFVAGCPPDLFTPDGQLWGNPLYDWRKMAKDNYDWWVKRVKWSLKQYDFLRIDHFRGFAGYWSVPYGDKTARRGHWIKGPGKVLFDKLENKLGKLPVIAEDLGLLTDDVHKLRRALGFPGMAVLQFAFDQKMNSNYLPHNLEKNCVVYTGTHDNSTMQGWYNLIDEETRKLTREYLGINSEEGYVKGFIRSIMTTVADTCILTMQDLLELDEFARMNIPGSIENNWEWRLKANEINYKLAQQLHYLTRITGRLTNRGED